MFASSFLTPAREMDIPAANLPPRIAKTAAGKAVGRKLILVLEQASLESVKTKKVRPVRAATRKPTAARARALWVGEGRATVPV